MGIAVRRARSARGGRGRRRSHRRKECAQCHRSRPGHSSAESGSTRCDQSAQWTRRHAPAISARARPAAPPLQRPGISAIAALRRCCRPLGQNSTRSPRSVPGLMPSGPKVLRVVPSILGSARRSFEIVLAQLPDSKPVGSSRREAAGLHSLVPREAAGESSRSAGRKVGWADISGDACCHSR
jgi:hypothetical protein